VYHFHHLLLYLNLKDSGCYSITRPYGRCFAADCINLIFLQHNIGRTAAVTTISYSDEKLALWKAKGGILYTTAGKNIASVEDIEANAQACYLGFLVGQVNEEVQNNAIRELTDAGFILLIQPPSIEETT